MRKYHSFLLVPVALMMFLFACTPTGTATPTPLAETATPAATVSPPTALTVCLGSEPASLYPVDNPSSSARAVLAAIYDGPIDTVSYDYQPVILETLPNLENGDAEVFPSAVYVGDEVVDADGIPVTLMAGTRIRPVGCRSGECAIEYDGRSEVQMDQMVVTFRLLAGLEWSDGEPLTASDSVYSFQVAKRLGNNYLVARTQSYEAGDETTVQWWGRPGFVDPTYVTNFFFPLPEHLWGDIPADELADSEAASLNPTGWGPFVIDAWDPGDSITLIKNPRYFRTEEDLPKIDLLVFRFTPDPEDAIAALLAGQCDVIDPSVPLDGQVALLQSLEAEDQLRAAFITTPVMEQLAFGILPAEYDNGNNPLYDRPDYFGDGRVRHALAMCIDRQRIVDEVLYGLSSVPASFVPDGYPFFDEDLAGIKHDISAANALLEAVGWRDVDGDPTTTRQAWGVAGINNGTPFEVSYVTTGATQRRQVADLVAASLAECGIQVNLTFIEQDALYASGPDGPLFGRGFELAVYAMGSLGIEPPCEWYTENEIPDQGNRWVGTNLSGYRNADFDQACTTASYSLAEEAMHGEAYSRLQSIFIDDVPSLPLYWRIKVAASRPEVCGFTLDVTTRSALWNIEVLGTGQDCAP